MSYWLLCSQKVHAVLIFTMNFVIFLVDRVQQDLRKGIVKENSNGALNVCPNGIFVI